MSSVATSEKAASATDIRKLLEATHAMEAPLDVPVLFLHDNDFYNVSYNSPNAVKKVRKQFTKKVKNAPQSFQNAYDNMRDIYGPLYKLALERNNLIEQTTSTLTSDSNAYGICQYVPNVKNYRGFADSYKENDFIDPILAIIAIPHKANGYGPLPPNLSWGLHYFTTWHEIGHSVQAGEAQADAIATVMCRQNLKDTAVLKICADNNVLVYAASLHGSIFHDYMWNTVDTIDYFSGLPDSLIEKMDKEQIKRLRFLNFPHTEKSPVHALRAVFQKAALENPSYFTPEDIAKLTDTTEYFLKRWRHKKGRPEYAVLQRFHLAVYRNSNEIDAYYNDTLEEKMREDGYRQNFLPKSLPEFPPEP